MTPLFSRLSQPPLLLGCPFLPMYRYYSLLPSSGLGWLLWEGYPTPGLSSLRVPKRLGSSPAKKPHPLPLIICTENPLTLKSQDVSIKTNLFWLFNFYFACLNLEWFSGFHLFSKAWIRSPTRICMLCKFSSVIFPHQPVVPGAKPALLLWAGLRAGALPAGGSRGLGASVRIKAELPPWGTLGLSSSLGPSHSVSFPCLCWYAQFPPGDRIHVYWCSAGPFLFSLPY